MKELIENAEDFLEMGEQSMKSKKWNVAVSNFFRAVVNFCDYLIFRENKMLPSNHNERFILLKTAFPEVYSKVIDLFSIYRESYNIRLNEESALKIRRFAYELKESIRDKEKN